MTSKCINKWVILFSFFSLESNIHSSTKWIYYKILNIQTNQNELVKSVWNQIIGFKHNKAEATSAAELSLKTLKRTLSELRSNIGNKRYSKLLIWAIMMILTMIIYIQILLNHHLLIIWIPYLEKGKLDIDDLGIHVKGKRYKGTYGP